MVTQAFAHLTTSSHAGPVVSPARRTMLFRVFLAAIVVLTLFGYLAAPVQRANMRVEAAVYSFPFGDRYLSCEGSGSPTVLLEAGHGFAANSWDDVVPLVAGDHRVCAWDRPGLGSSTPLLDPPSTGADLAAELHALLGAAGEEGPYLVVGFSIGGMLARSFANQYPDETVGIVLIDPTPPDWPQAHIDQSSERGQESLRLRNSGLDEREPELIDLLATGRALIEDEPNILPTAIITAGNTAPKIAGYGAAEQSGTLGRLQLAQAAVMEAQLCVATGTTHNIPEQRPRMVSQAIEVVALAIVQGLPVTLEIEECILPSVAG